MEANERAYWTKEVAERLSIGESTLRKWCLALEDKGYQFTKGQRGSRAFVESDIEVLTKMKNVLNQLGTSIEQALEVALNERENAQSHDVHTFEQLPAEHENMRTQHAMSPEIMSALMEKYKDDLLEVVRDEFQQTLKIQGERTEERLRAMEERTLEREKKRDENLTAMLRETLEVKKMIAASQESKKPWWKFWV